MKFRNTATLLVLIVLAITYSPLISAKTYMGKITIKVGETYPVSAVPTSGYTASGYWTKNNSHFVITSSGSYNCTIKGNTVGSGTLSYWGSVAPSNSWTTDIYDMYWDVEVKGDDDSSGGGSEGGGSGGGGSEDDKPTTSSDNWANSGNYSISWYNKNQTEFTLTTNKELAGLAYLLNNGYNLNKISIKLGADIDLSGKEWISFGTFNGSFDGQGHTIEGIEITTFTGKQTCFGFFSYLGSNSSIKNTIFKGYIYVKGINLTSKEDLNYLNYCIGGIVGRCYDKTIIENCSCEMSITFGINKLSISGNGTYSNVSIGGIVGYGSDTEISRCSHIGNIFNDSNECLGKLYLGGIVGHCYGKINRCEHISDAIGTSSDGEYSNLKSQIGGIAGYNYGSSIRYCRSIINSIKINSTRDIKYNEFYISGIKAFGTQDSFYKDINCYCSIAKIEISSNVASNLIKYDFKGQACFRNSDMVSIGTDASISNYSTAFTSAQMMTPAFLEELNLYPLLETDDGQVWAQDSNGGYPYIAELSNTTAIKTPKAKEIVSEQSVFTLSGQRLVKPQKGINIIGGRKVIVK